VFQTVWSIHFVVDRLRSRHDWLTISSKFYRPRTCAGCCTASLYNRLIAYKRDTIYFRIISIGIYARPPTIGGVMLLCTKLHIWCAKITPFYNLDKSYDTTRRSCRTTHPGCHAVVSSRDET